MAGDSIASLVVDIGANLASLNQGMREAVTIVGSAAKQMTDQFSSMEKQIGGVTGALKTLATTAVLGFSIKGLTDLVTDAVKAEEHLHDLATRVGSTASELSSLIPAARLSGSSIEEVGLASAKFAKNLATAGDASSAVSKALRALGFETRDVGRLLADPAKGLQELAQRMNQFADGGNKTALAMTLLGRGGAALLPFFKQLGEQAEVTALFTDAEAAAADRLGDSWETLKLRGEELHRTIGNGIAPALQTLIDRFLDATAGPEGFNSKVKALADDKTLQIWTLEVAAGFVRIKESIVEAGEGVTILVAALVSIAQALNVVGESAIGAFKQIEGALLAASGNALQGAALIRQGSDQINNALGPEYDKLKQSLNVTQIAWQEFWTKRYHIQSDAIQAEIAQLRAYRTQFEQATSVQFPNASKEALRSYLTRAQSPSLGGPGAPPPPELPTLDLGTKQLSEYQKALDSLEKQAATAGAELQALYSGDKINAAEKFINELRAQTSVWSQLTAKEKENLETRARNIGLIQDEATRFKEQQAAVQSSAAALERYSQTLAGALRAISNASAQSQLQGVAQQQDQVRRLYDRGLIDFKSFYDRQTALQRQALDIQTRNQEEEIGQQRVLLENAQAEVNRLGEQLKTINPANVGEYQKVLLLVWEALGKVTQASATLDVAQQGLNQTQQRGAEIGQESVEALHETNNAIESSVRAINDKVRAQEFENAAIGLTASQTSFLVATMLREQAAYEALHGATEERVADLNRQADAQERLGTAQAQGEGIQRALDAVREFDREAQSIFESVFDKGDDTFKRIGDSIKRYVIDLLYQLALKPFIVNIAAQITGLPVGNIAGALGLGGGGGGGVLQSLLGVAGGGGGSNPITSFFSNLFSGPAASTVAAFGPSAGGVALSSFSAVPVAFDAAATGASTLATSLAAGAQVATPALSTIAAQATAAAGTTAAAGAGMATLASTIGTAIPIIGAVIGIAYALGAFDKEPSKVKGQFAIRPEGTTTGFEDNAYTTASPFGNLGFVDENTQQFSGEGAQILNKVIAGALDAFEERFSPEQSARLATILQGTTFATAEGEYTTEDFLKTYGGDVLKQVVVAAFEVLDPALASVVENFEGTADEISVFANTLLSIHDATERFRDNAVSGGLADAIAAVAANADTLTEAVTNTVDAALANVQPAGSALTTTVTDTVESALNVRPDVTPLEENLQDALRGVQVDPAPLRETIEGALQDAVNVTAPSVPRAERSGGPRPIAPLLADRSEEAGRAAQDFVDAFVANINAALEGATQETANKVLAFVNAVNAAAVPFPEIAAKMAALSPDNIIAFVDALGGADKVIAGMAFLQANFTTAAERATQAQTNLSQAWDKAGLSAADLQRAGLTSVSTHEQFLQLVSSLDLSTEHGRALYAMLVNEVGPAFVAVAGTAEQAAAALNQQAQAGLSVYRQHFLTPEEQNQQRIVDASTQLYNFTKEGTRLSEVFKDLNLTIPTTVAETRRVHDAILAKYGAESDEYKLFLQIIPTIYELNDAAGNFGETVKKVTSILTVSVGSLVQAGQDAATALLGQFKSLAEAGTGDFGDKLTQQISLIADALENAPGVRQGLVRLPEGGAAPGFVAASGTVEQKAYANTLIASYNDLVSHLARFTTLSAQYDASRAEQLVSLQDWYAEQQKIFKNNDAALDAVAVIFKQKWDAIVSGSPEAAEALDAFIKRIQEVANATQGNAGQQAGIELALSTAKLDGLKEQLASLDPTSLLAKSIAADIAKLETYNAGLATQISHFVTYTAQYGKEVANQLVELENWYNDQKEVLAGNADALTILSEIFDEKWNDIVNGVKDGVNNVIDAIKKIRDYLESLKLSDISPLTPFQKFQEAQANFNEQLGLAQGGDTQALSTITDYAQQYLTLARDAYASSPAYSAIYDAVTGALEGLTTLAPATPPAAAAAPATTAAAVAPVVPAPAPTTSTTAISNSSTVTNTVSQIDNSVGTLNQSVQNLTSAISNLNQAIDNSQQSTSTVNQSVDNSSATTQVDASVQNLNTSVSSLTQSISNLTTSSTTNTSILSQVDSSVQNLTNAISNLTNVLNDSSTTSTTNSSSSLVSQVSNLVQNLSNAVTNLTNATTNNNSTSTSNLDTSIQNLSNIVNQLSNTVSTTNTSNVASQIDSSVQNLSTAISTLNQAIDNSTQQSVSTVDQSSDNSSSSQVDASVQTLSTSVSNLTQSIANLLNSSTVNNSAVSQVDSSVQNLTNAVSNLTSAITNNTNTVSNSTATSVQNLSNVVNQLTDSVSNLTQVNASSTTADNSSVNATSILNQYQTSAEKVAPALADYLAQIAARATTSINNSTQNSSESNLTQTVSNLAQSSTTYTDALSQVDNSVRELTTFLSSLTQSPDNSTTSSLTQVNASNSSVDSSVQQLTNAVSNLTQSADDSVTTTLNNASSSAQNFSSILTRLGDNFSSLTRVNAATDASTTNNDQSTSVLNQYQTRVESAVPALDALLARLASVAPAPLPAPEPAPAPVPQAETPVAPTGSSVEIATQTERLENKLDSLSQVVAEMLLRLAQVSRDNTEVLVQSNRDGARAVVDGLGGSLK